LSNRKEIIYGLGSKKAPQKNGKKETQETAEKD
jgi:hypothetical protein